MTTNVPRARRTEAARRRSAREWRALIHAQSRGDETRTQFCARHDVALSTFDWWRRRLHTEIGAAIDALLPWNVRAESAAKSAVCVNDVYGLLLFCKHFVRSRQGTTAYVYPVSLMMPST